MNLGRLIVRFFLNSGNLICRSTGISMYFRESLGVRGNESRLYFRAQVCNILEGSYKYYVKHIIYQETA